MLSVELFVWRQFEPFLLLKLIIVEFNDSAYYVQAIEELTLKWIEHKSTLAVGCSNENELLPALDSVAFHQCCNKLFGIEKSFSIFSEHIEVLPILKNDIEYRMQHCFPWDRWDYETPCWSGYDQTSCNFYQATWIYWLVICIGDEAQHWRGTWYLIPR